MRAFLNQSKRRSRVINPWCWIHPLKQAMMQELLTGETRLNSPLEAHA